MTPDSPNMTETKDETGWLIEYRHNGNAPTYWAGGKDFTFDSLLAVRFAREEDADRVMRTTNPMLFSTKCHASEHMWCGHADLGVVTPFYDAETVKRDTRGKSEG